MSADDLTRWRAAVLTLRLAAAATRRSLVPGAAGLLIVALGVVVLLAGLSMHPTAEARGLAGKATLPDRFGADGEPGLLVANSDGYYLGEPIAAHLVADTSGGRVVPPGLDRVPGPGEVVLSPAMRELWSDASTTLAQRYPGRDAGTVGRTGLVGPEQLVVWRGVEPDRLPETRVVTAFGGAAYSDVAAVPSELRLAVPLVAVGFLLPLGALFLTVVTTGTAARERRLAALRLLGLSGRHCQAVAAVEAALVVAPGALLGVLLFRFGAPALAPHLPVTGGVWPDQVHLSPAFAADLVLGLPVLATVAAYGSLRRVTVSPLGVARGAVDRQLGRWRLVPLAAGCVALAASAAAASGADDVTLAGVLLLVAVLLLLVGLVLAAPLVCRLVVDALGRVARGIPAQLATGRVHRDAVGAARLVTGSALLVFVSGLLLSFFPLLEDAGADGLREMRATVGGDVLVAGVRLIDPAVLEQLRNDPAVAGVARLTQTTVSDGDVSTLVTAVDCRDLADVVPALGGCSPGSLWLAPADPDPKSAPLRTDGPLQAVTTVERADGSGLDQVDLGPLDPSALARAAPVLESLDPVTGGTAGLVDLDALPAAAHPGPAGGMLLVRPAAAATGTQELERLRTLLSRATSAGSVLTVDEQIAVAERTTQTYRDITLTALGCAALVGVLTLASTLLQQVREHRRALVALWMTGVPARTLRTATLLQSALVVLPVVLLSLTLAVAAAGAYLALADDRLARLPWSAISLVAAGAALLPLLATSLTLPALRATARPQFVAD